MKPEFWQNEKLSALPEVVHMAAAALLNYADDDGFFNANAALIKAALFPLREPSVPIPGILRALSDVGYLRLGEGDDGRKYGHIACFRDHQSISKKTDSKISPLNIDWEDGWSPPVELREEDSLEGKGKEQGREGKRRKRETPIPPDFGISERVRKWAAEKRYTDLPEHLDHFVRRAQAKGYTYVDWDAALMNAIRDDWARVNSRAKPARGEFEGVR